MPIPIVEEGKAPPPAATRSLYKIVSEHKDVLKVVIVLSSIISSSKVDANKILEKMKDFQELWTEVSRLGYDMLVRVLRRLFSKSVCLRHGQAREDEARQGKARQGKTRQCKAVLSLSIDNDASEA